MCVTRANAHVVVATGGRNVTDAEVWPARRPQAAPGHGVVAYTRRPLGFLADPDALDKRGARGGRGSRAAAPAERPTAASDSQSPDSLLHVATRAAVLSSITAISRAYLEITG